MVSFPLWALTYDAFETLALATSSFTTLALVTIILAALAQSHRPSSEASSCTARCGCSSVGPPESAVQEQQTLGAFRHYSDRSGVPGELWVPEPPPWQLDIV
jgi:hypothetical protein